MSWLFVLEKVVGWAIPVICAAVMAWALVPLKKAKQAQERGQALIEQEAWDKCAKDTNAHINKVEENHKHDTEMLIKEIKELKEHDTVVSERLETIINMITTNAKRGEERYANMDAKNTAAFIQIYQRDLIVDGKRYIENKCITPQQLANFEKRYKQYKEWGGNGDVEPWIKKIRELPVHYPVINDFNEN